MKTILISALFAITLAFLAGCATKQGEEGSSPNNTGKVGLLFSKPERSYTEMGAVSTLKIQPERGQTWQNVLMRQAALMGADAVIVDTSTLNNITTPMVTGTAIKYKAEQPAK